MMKTKTVQAVEYNGRLYHSKEELKNHLAASVLWSWPNSGDNPRAAYRKLKEIYENEQQ